VVRDATLRWLLTMTVFFQAAKEVVILRSA